MKKVSSLFFYTLLCWNLWSSPQAETSAVPLSLAPKEPTALELVSLDLTFIQDLGADDPVHALMVVHNPSAEKLTLVLDLPPDGESLKRTVEPGQSLTLDLKLPYLGGNKPSRKDLGAQGPSAAHLWNHTRPRPHAEEMEFIFKTLSVYARVGAVKIKLCPLPGGWIESTFPFSSGYEYQCEGIPPQDLRFTAIFPGDYSLLGISLGAGANYLDGDWEPAFQGTLDLSLGPVQFSGGWEGTGNSPGRLVALGKVFFPFGNRLVNPLDADWDLRLGAGAVWTTGQESRTGFRVLAGFRWRWFPVEEFFDRDWSTEGGVKDRFGVLFVLGF